MKLSDLLPKLQQLPRLRSTTERLVERGGEMAGCLSLADAAKPSVLAALHTALGRPMLVVVAHPSQARSMRDEIACWHPIPANVLLFPELDVLPFEAEQPDTQLLGDRLGVLTALLEAGATLATAPLVVACGRAAADLLADPRGLSDRSLRVRPGDRVRPDDLLARLVGLGYEPVPVVDLPGQVGRRGGIVDIYPPVGVPCRLEFFGDEVESLRSYDPLTQRSQTSLAEALFTPTSTDPPGDDDACAILPDYLPPEGVLVLDEPETLRVAMDEFERQVSGLREDLVARGDLSPEAATPFFAWEQVQARLNELPRTRLELRHQPEAEDLGFSHPAVFGGRLRSFLGECGRLVQAGQQVVVVSQQTQRLQELFTEAALGPAAASEAPMPSLIQGQLQEGWHSAALGLTVFSDSEIFGWQKIRRPTRPRRPAGRTSFLLELTPGDLVVHVDHGIARYRGLVQIAERDGRAPQADGEASGREYLLLEYADRDYLYVPADQADRVSRYIGAGDAAPAPTRLGSGDWARAKSRVRRAVREIAQDLLELYAAREQSTGFAYQSDTPWQAELESSFPFVETPDQERALSEIKADMERPRPMDRLLVGDVGYGKTEVALRAAFKAIQAGKQVAVLVPTTVLAQQHWNTFRERLAAFPVRVEMLSRFRHEREQREVVQALAAGSVDICIGTHRLLQKDVAFKNLGLVIIDEEQRFGVTHKERLKQLRHEVDVLTLSATPIPRTLHMALVGVRDMSTIETPPEERLPVRTYVSEYDSGLVREAILRELDRGGQVFYVHNRVQTIAAEARRLEELVPEARFAVGHGQMPEEQLERVMLEFADGQHDVLVCTTIIESGLDIPRANTLIVNNAHRFGLSQLYQLRGRVGRSAARAYAYFFYVRDTALTEIAEKRLRTIFEATELGAGFRIALKDLEIRGAGNLLGAEQHGNISAVGFDLYTRLLGEAVNLLRAARDATGKTTGLEQPAAPGRPSLTSLAAAQAAASISLPIPAYLPADYVADEPTRLSFYQRLAVVNSGPELGELIDEIQDRYGPLPEPAQNLAYVVSLRLAAQRAGVEQVQAVDGEVVVKLNRRPPPDLRRLERAAGTQLRAGSNQIRLSRGRGEGWMVQLQSLVESLPGKSEEPGT